MRDTVITGPAAELKDSPRFAAIEGVFKLIDNPKATKSEIWKKMNAVGQECNADERDRLPALVQAAYDKREV
ncbi:MAG: hypothetical protein WC807_21050 [Hyphomicrobium sp.]|jgi:hypothetical protein